MITRRIALMVASAALAAILVGGLALAGASLDLAFSRYPGATTIAGDAYDLALVQRGWLTRVARYDTADDLETVARWYAALLQIPPDGDVHAAANCLSLRSEKLIARLVRTRSVQLCGSPTGTRIVVSETWFYSPSPARGVRAWASPGQAG